MPYIKQSDREKFKILGIPETAGQLNYLFTKISLSYIDSKELSYQLYNDVIGALEGCKLELYRKQISDYEDKKIIENGEIQ